MLETAKKGRRQNLGAAAREPRENTKSPDCSGGQRETGWTTHPSISRRLGAAETGFQACRLHRDLQREGSQTGAGSLPWNNQGQAQVRLREGPAHLGFHQFLFDAFGRIFPVVQLLQLPLGSLLCLPDVLQELCGLGAGFYSLTGERGAEHRCLRVFTQEKRRQKRRKSGRRRPHGIRFPAFIYCMFCVLGALFSNLAEFGTSLIVTNDVLPFLGVTKKSFVYPA